MIIEKLYMRNFRCFAGENTLSLAAGEPANTTMIFGSNGSGKTTLLNAFTWCLYGKTTLAFEDPNSLVSHSAVYNVKPGDKVCAEVSIVFSHGRKRYSIKRTRIEERLSQNDLRTKVLKPAEVSVKITEPSGATTSVVNPDAIVDSVLPERLHKYFFFDGERIEDRLMRGTSDVKTAITDLMGLEIIERAKHHLKTGVKRVLDSQLSEMSDSELAKIVTEIASEEDNETTLQEEVEQVSANIEASRERLRAIDERLEELEESKELQEEINRLVGRYDETEVLLAEQIAELRSLITQHAFLAFTEKMVSSCSKLIENAREKGEIPSDIKKQFVEDLLDNQRCICGTTLTKGTKEYGLVESWRERAGDGEVEQMAIQMSPRLAQLDDQRVSFQLSLNRMLDDIAQLEQTLKELEDLIDEKRRKQDEEGSEEVHELTARRKEVEQQKENYVEERGRKIEALEHIRKNLNRLEKDKDKYETANREANLVRRRQRIVLESHAFLEQLYEIRADQVRDEIDSRIKEIYQKISFKHYWPELDDSFNLVLKSNIGRDKVSFDVGKSTGENQILSLAFIGSIADYARALEKSTESNTRAGIGFRGGIYPLVIDSPFGQLDGSPKLHLAENLPRLADQLLIVVTQDKGLDAYNEKMREKAGKVYVLDWFTRKRNREETINLEGKSCPYVSTSQKEYDWVEIEEIK